MRVAFDTSICAFNQAGTARYARALLETLRDEAGRAGVTLIPLGLPRAIQATAAGPKRKAVSLFWEWVYIPWMLPALCQRHRCDLLHTTIPSPVRAVPCPVVTTVHDVIPILYPQWFARVMGTRLRRWIRRGVEQATHIIADSHSTAADLERLALAPHTPVTTIYPGSLLTAPSSTPSSPVAATGSDGYLLSVGTLEPRKNLGTVLEAYRLLLARTPTAPPLLVVGAADWMAEDVAAYAARLGVGEKVRLLGFVPDEQLPGLYQGARLLVYPSLYEGFGFPPLEAMSNGCPVVASNVSSIPEVVGEAGLLVEPTSASQVADAMHRLLTDEPLANRLRQRGREQARSFSWQRCAEETMAVYQSVLVDDRVSRLVA